MLVETLLLDAARVTVLLGVALAAMPLLRRSSAATRRLVLALALGGALVLPVVAAVVPAWRVDAPAAVASLRGVILPEPRLGPTDADHPRALLSTPETAAPRAGSTGTSLLAAVPALLAVVWGLGALLLCARLGVGLARSRALVKRSTPATSWRVAHAEAERLLACRAAVTVRATEELDTPAVAGLFAAVVLVPGASDSWSDERRRAVLLHELAHVRQRDCLVALLTQLACAAHWFNPLVWVAARRLGLERELAADDAVLVAGARASAYAEDLLAIAGEDSLRTARLVPPGALGMAGRSALVARVTAIVATTRARLPLTPARAAAVVLGGAVLLLAVACASPIATKPAAIGPRVALPPLAAGSTIDPRMQAVADDEIDRLVREWTPAAATILVLDPASGEILANAGRAGGAYADVAVKSTYVTGSTLKVFTLAGALDDGVLSPGERIDCEQGAWQVQGKILRDSEPNGVLSVSQMLAVSSNIGFAKVFERLGGAPLQRWLRAFHFGAAPAIDGAAAGELPPRIVDRSYAGAVVAIGESMQASPLQVAAGYAAIANGGVYVPPTSKRRAGAAPREQVLKPETARLVVGMLEDAVNGAEGTGKLAAVPGQRVAGKTGTAAWEGPSGGEGTYASFVGFVPAASPRFVILVGAEQPRDGGWGGSVAAPVFARVASRLLAPAPR